MGMKLYKVFAAAGIFALAAVLFFVVAPEGESPVQVGDRKGTLTPVMETAGAKKKVASLTLPRRQALLENISLIDHETLDDFQFLQHRFRKSLNLDDHLEQVKAYLLSLYDPAHAEALFEIYRAWLDCEMALAGSFQEITRAGSGREAADILQTIHGFRKQYLGEELAERLYGAALKESLYDLSKGAIVNDPDLYGEEKESLMAELDAADPEKESAAAGGYGAYQEKLKLYQKDLAEVETEDERRALIRQLREATLSPEAVSRMEAVDAGVRRRDERENNYQTRKEEILADSDLSADEKASQVDMLRRELFGEEGARAQVRKENMERGYQRIVSELNAKGGEGDH